MPAHTKNMGCFSYDVSIDATATVALAEAAARDAVAELGDYIKAESNAISTRSMPTISMRALNSTILTDDRRNTWNR